MNIRNANSNDLDDLTKLYESTFPDEDLVPLVTELLNDSKNTLTLVALKDDEIVGHIAFTKCSTNTGDSQLCLLGPIAISPTYQKQGIGKSLIEQGFGQIKQQNIHKVLVLGDPNFYSKFGFNEEKNIQPAYPIPKEWQSAWQSTILVDRPTPSFGKLEVPKAWQRAELWS